jgi:Mrp family chromosome partitioning ATPase
LIKKECFHCQLFIAILNTILTAFAIYVFGLDKKLAFLSLIVFLGSFIPGGTIPPNPTELILNGKLDLLIEQLKAQFDYIIIDTPPIGLVTDASILNNYSNLCLYIVRHNYTPKKFLKYMKELIENKSINNSKQEKNVH